MKYYELTATKEDISVSKDLFDYESAVNEANALSSKGFIVTLKPCSDQSEGVMLAAVQKHTRSAHSFIERTNEGLKPVVITRGEHSYTVPVEMLTKSGELKKTVKKIVDAYFARMAAC